MTTCSVFGCKCCYRYVTVRFLGPFIVQNFPSWKFLMLLY